MSRDQMHTVLSHAPICAMVEKRDIKLESFVQEEFLRVTCHDEEELQEIKSEINKVLTSPSSKPGANSMICRYISYIKRDTAI